MSTARTPTPVRAIGYVRVSTEEQAQSGLGIEAQTAAITAACDRRGWVLDLTADEGCSGKRINPRLRRALDCLAAGEADTLVVAKMDRLGRSVLAVSEMLEDARAQGWNLVVLDADLDLSTPQGRAMAHMLATFAELERELISARTRDALAARRARGQRLGPPVRTPDAVVSRIVAERQDGRSFRAIAEGLTADGVQSPTGMPTWQESSVRRTFTRAAAEAVA